MTARFKVGQIVELAPETTGIFRPGDLMQTGDRGTVIAPGEFDEGGVFYKVLWHKDGREDEVLQDMLSVFTHPMDKPGRATGAFATMEALRTVLQEEQQHAVSEILLNLERARMSAEDAHAAAGRWYCAKARLDHRVEVSRDLIEVARQTAITAADSEGTRANFRVALINVNNTLVHAWRATDGTDNEMESESDQESDIRQDEMETETENGTVPRSSFCEVCENYWDERTVVWYDIPFAHEGRNLYSACYRCRSQLGHQL